MKQPGQLAPVKKSKTNQALNKSAKKQTDIKMKELSCSRDVYLIRENISSLSEQL